MKKTILSYGTIAGIIIIGSMILSLLLKRLDESTVKSLEWLGYLIMIVAFSMIFVGIKRYRDRELGGVIRFGTAARLGLGITLVASVIYVAVWEVHQALTHYAFIGEYTQAVIAKKQAAGVSGAELEAAVAEMTRLKERYANPLFRVSMTFLEIFPVGLMITLLSAAVLRHSRILPATAPDVQVSTSTTG